MQLQLYPSQWQELRPPSQQLWQLPPWLQLPLSLLSPLPLGLMLAPLLLPPHLLLEQQGPKALVLKL